MFQARTLWEGRWIFALLLVALLALALLGPTIGYAWLLLPLVALAFSVNFFRDPNRRPPDDPSLLVAPADGVVTEVEETPSAPHLEGPARRISIFLSVFDVHVNRCPLPATVLSCRHQPGSFLDARHPEAHSRNESCTWHFEENGTGRHFVVRQITGAIARRIVRWSRPGDSLTHGQRFGMIRFGSRTDLFLPLDCEILIHPGQKVLGGLTPVARRPALPPSPSP